MIRKSPLILLFLLAVIVMPPSSLAQDTAPQIKIRHIAVLPFVNDTDYTQGDIIFYRIFVAEMHKVKGLVISQEGDVRKIYRQMRLDPKQTPDLDQLIILGDRLGVQSFIIGKIIRMSEEKGQLDAQPVIAVNVKMINAANGKTIMTKYDSRSGEDYRKIMHFGLVNTITELASLVSDEIVQKWFKGFEGK